MKKLKVFMLLICFLCLAGSLQVSAKELKTEELPISINESDYTFRGIRDVKEIAARTKVIRVAKTYYMMKEKSSKHKKLIKAYNAIKKNLYWNKRFTHFTATTSMAWCDIFASVVFQKANLNTAIGVECGCERHIQLLKKMGCWIEKDNYIPNTGDLIFYDWDDTGIGNNKGFADHVGIVVSVSPQKVITTIEGNYQDTVMYRALKVNSRYIRGFAVPKFVQAEENEQENEQGNQQKTEQRTETKD